MQAFIQKIIEDNSVKKSSLLEKLKKSVLVESEDVYNSRLNTCKVCEKLNNNFCGECHCYMVVKCALKESTCPLKKW